MNDTPQSYGQGSPFEVQATPEFQRVFDLPRRNWEDRALSNDLYKRMTAAFRLPGGKQELRPIQAAALADAHDQRGLLAPVSVGGGKTLVSYLLPAVIPGIKRPLLLLPAALVEKTWREFKELQRHWVCHPEYMTRSRFDDSVITYQALGREGGKDDLNERRPDIIVADECFTGETLVRTPRGNVRIDSLRVGDEIVGGDGNIEVVEAAWSSTPTRLVKVEVDNDRLYCTPNHPFLTERGWCHAAALEDASVVRLVQNETYKKDEQHILLHTLCSVESVQRPERSQKATRSAADMFLVQSETCESPREKKKILFAELQFDSTLQQPRGARKTACFEEDSTSVRLVQNKICDEHEQRFLFEILFGVVKHESTRSTRQDFQQRDSAEDEYKSICFTQARTRACFENTSTTYDREQPNVQERDPRENGKNLETAGIERLDPSTAWRKRAACPESATGVSGGSWLENGVTSSNTQTRQTSRTSLHDRYFQQAVDGSSGSRWGVACNMGSSANRSRERRVFALSGLARVSRVEQGCVAPYGYNGRVYNLQVSGSHTYVVGNGIIVHNCHKLANRQAACTKRVERFMLANPETIFCAMSGTITKRSLRDYWHLIYWALKEGAPLPRIEAEMEKWADALDERKVDAISRRGAGALAAFIAEEDRQELTRTVPVGRTQQMPAFFFQGQLAALRKGYQRRLQDTPGVISSTNQMVDCSLVIRRLQVDPGPRATEHLKVLRETRCTPNGDLMATPMDQWRMARELAMGFFYKWSPAAPIEWLSARKTWNWYVREILDPDGQLHAEYTHLHLDSPMQVALAVAGGTAAVEEGSLDDTGEEVEIIQNPVIVRQPTITDPNIVLAYQNWAAIRGSYKINTVAEWVDDTVLRYCLDWISKNGPGIVWTEHRALGTRLAQMLGTGFCSNGGLDANGTMIEDYAGKTVVASIAANSEGRNLQAWSRALITTMMPTGRVAEQLLGRLHRTGQIADTVEYHWIAACAEQDQGFAQMMADARYIEDTTGATQKLLYADHI